MDLIVALIAGTMFILILYKGFDNGFVLSVFGVITFVASYYLSYILAHPAGLIIHYTTGIYRFVAAPIGGIAIFFIINILGVIPKYIYKRVKRTRSESEDGKVTYFYKPSAISRLTGIALMMPVALFIVSFVYWTACAVRPNETGVISSLISWPAKLCIGHGFEVALGADDDVYDSEKMSQLIANPSEAANKINSVVNDPSIKSLITDQSLMSAIKSADPSQIESNRALNNLLRNDDAMSKLYEVGLTPEEYSSKEYRRKLSERLSRVGERIQVLENDPEFQQIAEKLKGQGGISQEQIRALLTDKQFLQFFDRVLYETKD